MKTYKIILFICLVQVFLSGCSKECPIEYDLLRIKVYNSSNYTLKNISFPSSLEIEEDLLLGKSSSVYKYKLNPHLLELYKKDPTVYSVIGVDINDYHVGQYIDLTDKILNNV